MALNVDQLPAAVKVKDGEVRNAALDGVRGLAISLVLIAHFGGGTHFSSRALQIVGALMKAGWVGVDLFFVLSGFLISGILFDSVEDPQYYKPFYARRTLRIFPIYYGVLLALLLLSGPLGLHWGLPQFSFFLYLNNIVLLLVPSVAKLSPITSLGPYWSLAVEEQFYLIWPWLIRFATRRNLILTLLVTMVCIPPVLRTAFVLTGITFDASYNLLFSRMDSLAWGAAVAYCVRSKDLLRAPVRLPLLIVAAAVVVFFVIGSIERSFFWATPLMVTIGFSTNAIGAAGLVWLNLYHGTWVTKLFSVGWLRSLGKYSYSIYIFHELIRDRLNPTLFPFLVRKLHNPGVAAAIYFVLALAITFGVAYLSYNLYEVRFLRLKRKFPYQKLENPSGMMI